MRQVQGQRETAWGAQAGPEEGKLIEALNRGGALYPHLGADPSMLATHVAVQRVARLGDGSAEDAAVARAHRVLVLHVGSQGVSGTIDLSTARARSGVRRPDPHHFELASH